MSRISGRFSLGEFVELEVVLRESELPADGEAEARLLMRKLGINEIDLLEGAYVDHLLAKE